MGEICKKTNIEHKKKNGKTLVVKPFLSGRGGHFRCLSKCKRIATQKRKLRLTNCSQRTYKDYVKIFSAICNMELDFRAFYQSLPNSQLLFSCAYIWSISGCSLRIFI